MRPDEYLDDDEEEGFSSRSIFASGWFRALMVLGVLGIVLVVTLPYAFKWIESPKPAAVAKRDGAPKPAAPAAPSAVTPVTVPTPGPAPAAAEKPAAESRPVATTVPLRATPMTPTGPAESPAPAAANAEKPGMTPKATAEKPAAPAKVATAEKPAAKHAEATVSAPNPVKKSPAAPAVAAPKGGDFFVQVGVFKDERNAERLAKTLRARHLPVQVSRTAGETSAPAVATTRHEVFVTGSNPQVVSAALRGNGSALAVRGGVAVQPSLELKEAVALSRKLSGEGLNVQIRRVGGDAAPASATGVRHLVRVGGYATRAEAQTVRTQLKRDGISAFVTPVATQ